MKNNQPQFSCRSCIYFQSYGENTRIMPCNGRATKTEKRIENRRVNSMEVWTSDIIAAYEESKQN